MEKENDMATNMDNIKLYVTKGFGKNHKSYLTANKVLEELGQEQDKFNSILDSDTLNVLLSENPTPAKTVVAVLNVISKLSTYAGPIGQVVNSVVSLVSIFIGGTTGGKAGEVAEKTVKNALRDQRQDDLLDDLAGLARLYREAQTYMNAIGGGEELSGAEVTHMLSMYSLTREPIRLLEKLRRHIERNLKQRTVEGARQVLKLTQLYCQMSTTRWLLLYQMCHLASQCKETDDTARGMKAILGLRIRHPELKWILQPATPAEALPSALYLPSVYPDIHRYIHFTCMSEELQEESIPGVLRDLPQPPTTPVPMAVEKWPRKHIPFTPDDQHNCFTVEFAPEIEGLWRLHLGNSGFVMKNKVKNMYEISEDGEQAMLVRYIKTRDGKTMLMRWENTQQETPSWLCVTSSLFSGRFLADGGTDDPGDCGYWQLNSSQANVNHI